MTRVLPTFVLFAALTGGVGCTKASQPNASERVSPDQMLVNLLYGSGQACESDKGCDGSVCYEGGCIGVLLAPEPWLQRQVALKVAEQLRGDKALQKTALEALQGLLMKPHANTSEKARTIPLLEELEAYPLLELLAGDPTPALANQASLALCRMGHASQIEFCPALTESDDRTIAVQAIHAMARSGYPDRLPVLLALLNPDLDRMLIRAALQALEQVGDPRALRPLVGFLRDSPDYLRLATVRTLRAISGSQVGQSFEEWRHWIAANNPPESPAYVLRRSNSTQVLGIPEP